MTTHVRSYIYQTISRISLLQAYFLGRVW